MTDKDISDERLQRELRDQVAMCHQHLDAILAEEPRRASIRIVQIRCHLNVIRSITSQQRKRKENA